MLLVEMFLSILLLVAAGYSGYLTYTQLYTSSDANTSKQAKTLVLIQAIQILVTIGLLVAAATTSTAPPAVTY